jgi:hypothetical protein
MKKEAENSVHGDQVRHTYVTRRQALVALSGIIGL